MCEKGTQLVHFSISLGAIRPIFSNEYQIFQQIIKFPIPQEVIIYGKGRNRQVFLFSDLIGDQLIRIWKRRTSISLGVACPARRLPPYLLLSHDVLFFKLDILDILSTGSILDNSPVGAEEFLRRRLIVEFQVAGGKVAVHRYLLSYSIYGTLT